MCLNTIPATIHQHNAKNLASVQWGHIETGCNTLPTCIQHYNANTPAQWRHIETARDTLLEGIHHNNAKCCLSSELGYIESTHKSRGLTEAVRTTDPTSIHQCNAKVDILLEGAH